LGSAAFCPEPLASLVASLLFRDVPAAVASVLALSVEPLVPSRLALLDAEESAELCPDPAEESAEPCDASVELREVPEESADEAPEVASEDAPLVLAFAPAQAVSTMQSTTPACRKNRRTRGRGRWVEDSTHDS